MNFPYVTLAQIKRIRTLQRKKHRHELDLFFAEGEKLIPEAMRDCREQISEILITEDFAKAHSEIFSAFSDKVFLCSEKKLIQAGTLNSNRAGLVVLKAPKPETDFQNDNIILATEDIRDPGNFGTLLRMCDWYGIRTVLCSEHCVDVLNPKVVAASMGAVFRINVHYGSLERFFSDLSHKVYAATLGGRPVYQTSFEFPAVLLIGNESAGLKVETEAIADFSISIPKFGKAESLNAGVAAAVLTDHMVRVLYNS